MREIDKELNKLLKGKPRKVLDKLRKDSEVNGFLEQANDLAILRLGYNDHGIMHSKIVACNALKIFEILQAKGFQPNIVKEGNGNLNDARIIILTGAYLHDIGCAISRENHELFGVTLAVPIIKRILGKFYKPFELARITSLILEAIACHMGECQATSLEAKIVEVADGTDITKGRARIPFHIGIADIHKFSALAIEKVAIKEGKKKPLKIEILMDNPAGIFQAEETLLKKIRDAKFEEFVEVIAKIKGEKEVKYL